jgi:hypothetical protein
MDCHRNPRGPHRYPEQPIVRYDFEPHSTSAGNVEVWSQYQSPEFKGRQFFIARPEETRMLLKIDGAATRDIAKRYQEGI